MATAQEQPVLSCLDFYNRAFFTPEVVQSRQTPAEPPKTVSPPKNGKRREPFRPIQQKIRGGTALLYLCEKGGEYFLANTARDIEYPIKIEVLHKARDADKSKVWVKMGPFTVHQKELRKALVYLENNKKD